MRLLLQIVDLRFYLIHIGDRTDHSDRYVVFHNGGNVDFAPDKLRLTRFHAGDIGGGTAAENGRKGGADDF